MVVTRSESIQETLRLLLVDISLKTHFAEIEEWTLAYHAADQDACYPMARFVKFQLLMK